jgi:hypothetical protein
MDDGTSPFHTVRTKNSTEHWGLGLVPHPNERGGASDVSRNRRLGSYAGMTPSSIVVILIGIVLALLVSYVLGIIVILIGLAMLLVPMLGGTRRRV